MRVEGSHLLNNWILTKGSEGAAREAPEGGFQKRSVKSTVSSVEQELDLRELQEIERLKRIDRMVRAHERAHLMAAGPLVVSGPHYVYKVGPDGKRYAVGGDVKIDVSPVPGNPEATIRKAERIVRAALAPLNPSPQDRMVAMKAQLMAQAAKLELAKLKREEMREASSGENSKRGNSLDNGSSGGSRIFGTSGS